MAFQHAKASTLILDADHTFGPAAGVEAMNRVQVIWLAKAALMPFQWELELRKVTSDVWCSRGPAGRK